MAGRVMKALVWHGRHDVRLEDVAAPGPPRSDEVTLAVDWCGICGTDVEEWRHGPTWITHDPDGRAEPVILGHELSGRVVSVGDDVTHLRPGERVAVEGLQWCGRCYWCLRHRGNLCQRLGVVGLTRNGGLAEWCTVPAATCFVLDDRISSEAAALAETLSVGLRALRRGRCNPGDQVTVLGAGAVGLLTAQAARVMGAGSVWVVEPHPDRRKLAGQLGADEVVDPSELPPGRADLVVECAGTSAAIETGVGHAKAGGRIVLVGLGAGPSTFDPLNIIAQEKEIIGSLSHVYDEDFSAALGMLKHGAIDTRPVVTDRIPLAQALDQGLLALANQPREHVKILVSPGLYSP